MNPVKWFAALAGIYIFSFGRAMATPGITLDEDPLVTSTQQEAIRFLNNIKELAPSAHWPNINPDQFLRNLKADVNEPISIYPGRGTYFCGYGAFTYLFLQDDPLGFTKLVLQLYKEGKASFGRSNFDPSAAVKKEAGLLKYKGIMDIHPADQMWFLSLADHFKGYLNIFNRKYDPGDEDEFWASVNYAKFNRMMRAMQHYKISAWGGDLIRPAIDDLYTYISEKLNGNKVVLYINNRIVHKKNHVAIKLGVPTHFVVLERISKVDDVITLVYWDYGGRTLIQLSPAFLKKILFGITVCSKK